MAEDSVIADFQNITGCDVERAKFYLESANMQLDLAISNFYESDGMEESEPVPENNPAPQVDKSAAGGPPATAAASAPAATGGASSGAGRLNLNMRDDDSDSEDEGQAFYAGGSSSSGNVILGPGKKKKDIVGKLFRKAKESGAEEVGPGEDGPSGSRAFVGGGFRLGSSETDPSVAVGVPIAKQEKPRSFVLKMWQDGFSIDDGDLREYTNPENRQFLDNIMRGSIPPELVREAKGGEVHVDMEDHRNEEFVKPTVKAKPFQGSGNVLGSIAPQMTGPSQPTADPAAAEADAKKEAKVDESQPTTNIQVRLADGSRLVVRLNQSQTVGHLRNYVCTARSQYASVPFGLHTTFPNKEHTDNSQTIKDAGLLGAAVLQRLK